MGWMERLALLAVAGFGVFTEAADTPALDCAKYPQDTPQKALASLIKALEAEDYVYSISFLLAPQSTQRLGAKYDSVEKAAAANREPERQQRRKAQCELMKKMLEANATTEGEENGVKWVRFKHEDSVLQLEKQPDGRWCMNTQVGKAAAPAAEKK